MDDQLSGFGERLLAVIDEGRRISTYKLALLLALIDVCARQPGPDGAAPDALLTVDVSRRVAELYWPQVRPFQHGTSQVQLRQISAAGSEILNAVAAVVHRFGERVPFVRAEEQDPVAVAGMVKRVDRVVRTDPLRRLHTINGIAQAAFIYDIEAGGHRIRFKAAAGDALVRLAPLVRPLVELHWVREVARRNHVAAEEQHLYRHLFGVQRTGFPGKLRDGLVELQGGACFYCGSGGCPSEDTEHGAAAESSRSGRMCRLGELPNGPALCRLGVEN